MIRPARSRMSAACDQSGVALPLALLVLAVVGALVGAAFWIGVAERRAGLAMLALQGALGEAERASQVAVSGWEASRLNSLGILGTTTDTARGLDGRITSMSEIRRLSPTLFLITGIGFSRSGAAVQRVGVLARLSAPSLAFRRPLLASGPVTLAPGSRVVAAPTGAERSCGHRNRGDEDDSASSLSAEAYEDLQRWVSRATKIIPPGRYGPVSPSHDATGCRTRDPQNWGDPVDPTAPCGEYLPIVFAAGDLVIIGGAGQGVLLVRGDLTVRGGFIYHGLVIVGGTLRIGDAGVRIVGAVQVGDPQRGEVVVADNTIIEYSLCAVSRALAGSARVEPLTRRSWLRAY